ncbi:MAG: DUF354 domain-containing protein [Candidatus Marinimicrobia bacterium]|nr:DUF354 domain-containing protein [Candidatus Neomarinimicrobiota bacterium]
MPKKILFDIGHPKQVHQFKYTYWELERRGWDCLFIAKNKDITIDLLEKYNLEYISLGKNRNGIFNKIFDLPQFEYDFYKIVINYTPDIIVSRFSAHSAHIARLLNIPHIGFTDTENATLLDSITVPFVNVKLTAKSYMKSLGINHYRYDGNIELAYLHPNRYRPNHSILERMGVRKDEKYAIIRFVSWKAYHDIGENGFSLDDKINIVKTLSKYAKIFISSENGLPVELSKYKISIPPESMHDALNYASLYIGESPTMTSESGILGTPAICVSSWAGKCGNFRELSSYDLLKCFQPENSYSALRMAVNILKNDDAKVEWNIKRAQFLADKIDVSSYMVWFITNFPESIKIQQKNGNYVKELIS